MIRVCLLIFIVTLFISCENNSSKNKDMFYDDISYSNVLYYEQWCINKNNEFYAQNNINNNAHININSNSKYTGKGITIAIIDNGFDVNHPEIKNNIIKTAYFDFNGNFVSNDVSHSTSFESHGTAVAGIIAANDNSIGIRGIAPDVNLILIKMPTNLTDSGTMKLFQYAVDNGADIINCSWGTNDVSDIFKNYIKSITTTTTDTKGVVIVFSSGNGGNDSIGDDIINDESSISTVIGVGATNKNNLRTTYSNYGNDLDIVAPGGEYLGISTIDPVGTKGHSYNNYIKYNENKNNKFIAFTGTSASAPIVSGSIALALEKNNSLTRSDIQNLLKISTSLIGNNTPYIDDMIISSSSNPIITGIIGDLEYDQISISLVTNTDVESQQIQTYGPYSIIVNNDRTFFCEVEDNIPQGHYKIYITDNNDENLIWAIDDDFEINYSKINQVNKEKRKSIFYGYGKINVEKLLSNITTE